jgi:murein DD-endopeptidase MepM/ murein hydrolase activator NlpD
MAIYGAALDRVSPRSASLLISIPSAFPHTGSAYRHLSTKVKSGFAVADGKVKRVYDSKSYGNTVIIKLADRQFQGFPIYALYAHLSSFAPGIEEGKNVSKGQIVGLTGNTGNAGGMTGNNRHLHFEFKKMLDFRDTSTLPFKGLEDRFNPELIYGPPPMNVTRTDPVDSANANSAST